MTLSGRSFSLRRQPLVTMRPFAVSSAITIWRGIDFLNQLAQKSCVYFSAAGRRRSR